MSDQLRPGFPVTASLSIALKAAYHYVVPHAYHLGGFRIFPCSGLKLDDLGLSWVRTFILWHQRDQIGYRMINPEDLPELMGHESPSCEQIVAIYGKPVPYENVRHQR